MLKGTNLVHYSLPQHHGCIARTRQSMIDEEVDGLAAHKTVAVFDEAIPSILDFDTISKLSSDCLKIQRMTCGGYFGHLAIFMKSLAASWCPPSSSSAVGGVGIGTGTLIDFWEIHEMAGTVMSIEGQKIQRSLMT
jgi:hypothetical protein